MRNIIELVENKFYEICERDNLAWWELFDSEKMSEVDNFFKSLNPTKRENKLYGKWCAEMGKDL